ncbi:MAG: hypothetical protein NT150_15055 [Bacteroidetes bacterium]|nr:hypothetical protein [Bacteroidota bacterium]
MRLILCFFAVLFLSSCFEIIEDIRFQANYSGTYKVTINMSASKVQINSYMKLDSVFGSHVPKKPEIEKEIQRKENLLKAHKGIKNVLITRDYVSFIFTVKFDFDNLNSFKEAHSILTSDKKTTNDFFPFSQSGNSFNRKDKLQTTAKDMAKKKKEYAALFTQSTYTSIIHFPKEINTCSNKNCKLSKDKKNMFVSSSLENLVNDPNYLNTQIIFK